MKGTATFFLLTLMFGKLALGQQSSIFLTENKGQWPSQVLASVQLSNGNFYLEKQGFTYDFVDENISALMANRHVGHSHEPMPDKIHRHAVKVHFDGALVNGQITREDPSPTRFNYLLGKNKNNWIHNARAYGIYTIKDLYPGIDLKLYSAEQLLKYDLVLKPGASAESINMNYEGATQIDLRNKNLFIQTSLYSWQEMKPYAYQLINGEKKEIACSYQLTDNNRVSFRVGKYDKNVELVIDPILVVSTYSGSFANNFGYTATYDSYGFLYTGSSALGRDGYPITAGAYDASYNGGYSDVAITKYDTTGTFRVYSTLIGGTDSELPHSLVVDSRNQLIIYGTTSSANFPTAEKGFDTTFQGGPGVDLQNGLGVDYTNGADIFVTKLSHDGSDIIGGTLLGGSKTDGINIDLGGVYTGLRYNYADEIRGEVLVDDLDNCYIVTTTTSNDIPYISAGAFQAQHRGGLDGVIFKLDHNFEHLLWASYLGGAGNDAIYSIDIDRYGRVTLAGGTTSNDLSVTDNAFQKTYGGGRADGFVAMVAATGDTLKSLTYWGSTSYDQIYLHEFGTNYDIYLFGQTEDRTDRFYFNHTGFGQPNSGQFITKISGEVDSLMYSLTYGNGIARPNLSPTAFLVDNCGNIYTSGWGGETNMNGGNMVINNAQSCSGLPTTVETNPFFRQTTDNNDFHIMVLSNEAANLTSGFYFGEIGTHDHVDGGTSRFDKKSQIYQSVCASCGNKDNFPTTPGAVSSTNNANCNNAVFKIDFQTQGVSADFAWTLKSCAQDSIYFDNRSFAGLNYSWDFGDGSPKSTQAYPVHVYSKPGVYYVTLRASNDITCNKSDSIVKRVVIYPIGKHLKPDTLICLSDTVKLGFETYPGAYYSWFPGTGLSDSTVADPYFFPGEVQQYRLVVNAYGCYDTTYIRTTVDGVAASFVNSEILCQNDSIQFTNYSISADKYLWSFGDGEFSQNSDPKHLYTTPGIYQVVLYSTTFDPGPVCQPMDSMVKTVTVFPNGIHHYPDSSYCLNDTIRLGPPAIPGVSYKWSPAIGLSSIIVANPTLTATVDTVYRLVSSSGGCRDTSYYPVKTGGVLANFSTTFEACVDGLRTFSNLSKNASDYQWFFGDGTGSSEKSPAHKYSDPGIYFVTLIGYSNKAGDCPGTDTTQHEMLIYPNGSHQLPDTIICRNDTTRIGDYPIPKAKYSWSPSNGLSDTSIANPILIPDSTRIYTRITTSYYCSDTTTVKVVAKGVSADFTTQFHVCDKTSLSFTNKSVGAGSYLWRFGDGTSSSAENPSHLYPGPGTYWVTLISIGGDNLAPCPAKDSVVKQVVIHATGNTLFPDTIICRSDSTQIGIDPIPGANYSWSPTAGLSDSTIPNPYALADTTITYTLTVYAYGCIQTIKAKIIPRGVKADFTYTNALCENDSIKFINKSLGATSYKWTFGDNGTSTIKEPKHLYNTSGIYAVQLVALGSSTSPCPSSDTLIRKMVIYPNGKQFLPQSTYCLGDSIQIGPTPLPGSSYFWTPTDGLSDPNIANPYAYPDSSIKYTLVSFAGGCLDSTFIEIKTKGVKADFSFITKVCSDDSVYFSNKSLKAKDFLWKFGDGIISSSENPTHLYPLPGTYTVKLYCSADNPDPECPAIDSAEKIIAIYPSGVHYMGDTIVCRNDTLEIGPIPVYGAVYKWTPAIGLSSTIIANPQLYPDVDTTYRLVTTAFGCADTSYYTFTSQGVRADFFYPQGVCENNTINFSNTSKKGDHFQWDFGDQSGSTDKDPSHLYNAPGIYPVKLIATLDNPGDNCPGIDSIIRTVSIFPNGFEQYPDTTICRNDSVQIGPEPIPGASYHWTPENGLSDPNISNPVISPDSTRTYTLVTTALNCSDTIQVNIITKGVKADFTNSYYNCSTDSVYFTNTSLGTINTIRWEFGDGTNSSTVDPWHKFPGPGVYNVRLIVSSSSGEGSCSAIDSIDKQIIIYPHGNTVLPDTVVCRSDSAQIGTLPIPGASYSWSPSIGLSDSTVANPYLFADSVRTYILTITAYGCKQTTQVTVKPRGLIAAFDFNETTCENDSVYFVNNSISAGSYLWDFGDNQTSTATNPAHRYSGPGTYTVRLIGFSASSTAPCPAKDTIIKEVTIHPNGKQILPSQNICIGDTVQIGPIPLPGTSYFWTPARGLSDPTIANPLAYPDTTITYTLIGVSGACLDSTIVTVNISGVMAGFSVVQSVCQGDTLFFTNTSVGGDLFTWDFGDNITSNDTNTFHVYGSGGTYTVSLVATDLQPGNCPATNLTTKTVNIYHHGNHSLPDTTICVGDSVRLGYNPVPGESYDWTPGIYLSDSTTSNPILLADSTTSYIMISRGGGCSDTIRVNVNIAGVKADFIPTTPFTCQNDTFFFTNKSLYADTYKWRFPDGTFSTTTDASHWFNGFGKYYIELIAKRNINPSTCPNSDTIKLPVYIYPDSLRIISSPVQFCIDTVFRLDTLISAQLDSLPGATYTWIPGTGVYYANWANPVFDPKGDGTYTLISAAGQCSDTLQVRFESYKFDLVTSQDTLICSTQTTMKVKADGKGSIHSFLWSDKRDFSNVLTTDSVVSVSPANFSEYFIKGISNSCAFTDSIQIVVLNNDTVLADSNLFMCRGQQPTIGFTSLDPTATFRWIPSSYLSDSTIGNPITTTPDSIRYELKVTTPGCYGYFYFNVNVDWVALLSKDSIFWCDPSTPATILANGMGKVTDFSWSPDTLFNTLLNSSPSDSTVTVTPPQGEEMYYVLGKTGQCNYLDSIRLITDYINLGLDDSLVYCQNGSITLNAFSQGDTLQYNWQPANLLLGSNNKEIVSTVVNADTLFTLTATNKNGCSITDSIRVVPSKLKNGKAVIMASDTFIYNGFPVTLTALPKGAYYYHWEPDSLFSNPFSPAQTVYTKDSTTIYLSISDGYCVVGDAIKLRFSESTCGPPYIYVPNAFTPNTDKMNDLLFVRGGYIKSMYFVIYDRWGEKIFETRDQKIGWDGKYKGKILDPAVFVYYLEATCIDNMQYFEKGNITLIR